VCVCVCVCVCYFLLGSFDRGVVEERFTVQVSRGLHHSHSSYMQYIHTHTCIALTARTLSTHIHTHTNTLTHSHTHTNVSYSVVSTGALLRRGSPSRSVGVSIAHTVQTERIVARTRVPK
jgi:hypothetical protein